MQTAVKTTPPPVLASTPHSTRITPLTRLLLLALARSSRPLTQPELVRNVPCSTGSASRLTRDLLTGGLLIAYPGEYGVPTTYALTPAAITVLLHLVIDPSADIPEVAA